MGVTPDGDNDQHITRKDDQVECQEKGKEEKLNSSFVRQPR